MCPHPRIWKIASWATALAVGCFLTTRAGPAEAGGSVKYGEAWGATTNQFCAGIFWATMDFGKGVFQDVDIVVKTSKTNAMWDYLIPPGRKLAKVELRDAQGVLLVPLKGKKLDGDLPQRILTKDLPRVPRFGHSGGFLEGWLILGPNLPDRPWQFPMQDIYRIEKEGEYTFTVNVAIYHFMPDQQSVVRMDLPPVSTNIHLTPSGKAKTQ